MTQWTNISNRCVRMTAILYSGEWREKNSRTSAKIASAEGTCQTAWTSLIAAGATVRLSITNGFPRFRPRHGTVFATVQASKASATPEPETPKVSPPLRTFRHVRRTALHSARPDHPSATSKTRRDGEGLEFTKSSFALLPTMVFLQCQFCPFSKDGKGW